MNGTLRLRFIEAKHFFDHPAIVIHANLVIPREAIESNSALAIGFTHEIRSPLKCLDLTIFMLLFIISNKNQHLQMNARDF